MVQHYLSELDFEPSETREVLELARTLKLERGHAFRDTLRGKHIALYFEKPSVRTRVSFTVGVQELGGQVVELSATNTKLGKGEHVEDFASVIGRYVHALVARVFDQSALHAMSRYAGIPVVNALSDDRHPCQALADVLTILERTGRIEGVKVVFVGEGNNVATSTGLLAASLGAEVVIASPEGYGLPAERLAEAKGLAGSLTQTDDALGAAKDADVLYTDTWISMGQEEEAVERRKIFAAYKITAGLLDEAASHAIVMHCLPAVRGEEIDRDLMYGKHSAIWQQAENRLHVQKALLCRLLG
ncbi:MAG: ornithine carbamoyltransferase [Deltaproteobacteria bacterium]|jgi:ornithine carbamoyltransferase